jgi:DNA-binding response OmpR family regulator
VTHAFLHIAETGARVASDVRHAIRLAGGRITSTPERARLHVACARSCRDACLPSSGRIRVLVAEAGEDERKAARASGFDDVIDPILKTMVEPLRRWLELAERPSVQFHVAEEGIVIDGVLIKLWPLELALVRKLDEANGKRLSRRVLLADVWHANPDSRTQSIATTVYNVNRKTRPFGVEIAGDRNGWRMPRSAS